MFSSVLRLMASAVALLSGVLAPAVQGDYIAPLNGRDNANGHALLHRAVWAIEFPSLSAAVAFHLLPSLCQNYEAFSSALFSWTKTSRASIAALWYSLTAADRSSLAR
jgi:hypothetical protein